MEGCNIFDRAFQGGKFRRCKSGARGAEFGVSHRELVQIHLVVAARQALQSRIALGTHESDDLADGLLDIGARTLGGTGEGGLPAACIESVPVEDAHANQASIFSTGKTRRALAPAFFRLSRVSQNTFSRHTACTATRSGKP